MNQAVRIASHVKPSTHVLIVLHGLGDTGSGWTFLASELQNESCFASTKFIFPNAPHIPITANNGMHMPGWFDIKEWDPHMKQFDTKGYIKSLKEVEKYVQEELANGIPAENIIIGGFSQGAALSLGSALNLQEKIGGFFALSGFINTGIKDVIWNNDETKKSKSCNLNTPIFHGHGNWDPVVSIEKGRDSRKYLTDDCQFKDYKFHEYAHLEHSVAPQELKDLITFIKDCWKM